MLYINVNHFIKKFILNAFKMIYNFCQLHPLFYLETFLFVYYNFFDYIKIKLILFHFNFLAIIVK